MNDDEIQLVARIRPEAAPYDPGAKAAARRGLAAAAASRPAVRSLWSRPRMMVLAGALAVAAGAAGAVVVAAGEPGGEPGGGLRRGPAQEVVVAMPETAPVSASEVLGRAAEASRTELDPRDEQFIRIESETMYRSYGDPGGKRETRHLYRTKRVIWLSADNSRDGSLTIEHLEPKAYPGWPIPEDAYDEVGRTDRHRLPVCGGAAADRPTHYTALKRLPADADGMRAHLYTPGGGDASADEAAWDRVNELVTETYMPPAQRAALFRAAATIPGVDVVENAEDAAGRTGIGVGRVDREGIRGDLVFDPETYELLGYREIVVDAGRAGAPEGSLMASTAQLSVTVADEAPEVDEPAAGCDGGA
ncbi:hypothetical protein GCM10010466_47820 [Planomonospora alba]|uniref:CU044_5270 family protein n=1 Tax=Planomonospora alba TaxID=161354 RepID=A0ABP6NMF6_9ACTN